MNYLKKYFCSKVYILNVNCARATAFIFDTRTGVLVKVSTFFRQKMPRPEGDLNPQLSDISLGSELSKQIYRQIDPYGTSIDNSGHISLWFRLDRKSNQAAIACPTAKFHIMKNRYRYIRLNPSLLPVLGSNGSRLCLRFILCAVENSSVFQKPMRRSASYWLQ